MIEVKNLLIIEKKRNFTKALRSGAFNEIQVMMFFKYSFLGGLINDEMINPLKMWELENLFTNIENQEYDLETSLQLLEEFTKELD